MSSPALNSANRVSELRPMPATQCFLKQKNGGKSIPWNVWLSIGGARQSLSVSLNNSKICSAFSKPQEESGR